MSKKNNSSRLVINLSNYYDHYIDQKKTLLNHPKIVEYLFNNSSINICCPNDLVFDHDPDIRLVRLDDTDSEYIKLLFFNLIESLTSYSSEYDNKRIPSRVKINYLPNLFDLDSHHRAVMKILDKLESQQISYVYQWSFTQEGKHLSTSRAATVNFTNETIFDFFGVSIYHSKMDLFVIQLNSGNHVDNIFMEFMLAQMNVHFLRLKSKSNINNEIINFFKKIRKTTERINIHPSKPITKIMTKEMPNISQFSIDYNYNHKIYLRNPLKENENFRLRDNNFIDSLSKAENCYPKDGESTVVDNNFVENIVKEKESMYYKKPSRAEQIMVELIGAEPEDILTEDIIEDIMDISGSVDDDDLDDNEILQLVYTDNKKKSNKEIITKTKGFKLDKFLTNYKPKTVNLSAYMKLDKLKGYKLMNDVTMLRPNETYIKYIEMSKIGEDDDLESHVRFGGVLLKGGILRGKRFETLDDKNKWVHLRSLVPKTDEKNNQQNLPMHLTINTHYIFYRYM